MKRSVFLIAFLIAAYNLFAQTDTIFNRYRQYIFATTKSQNDVSELAGSLDKNGQWSDINYQDNERANWKPLIHLKRARDLAFAYANPQSHFYHQSSILQAGKLALDHWLNMRYKCPNWWHNEIGVPQVMRDIVILLQPDLSAKQLQGALEVLAQYRVHENSTGANLTWSADLGVHYGLLTNDNTLAQKCRALIIDEIKITTGDGVQPDYSFHQHDKRLQMYQYGGAFLWENVRLAWELRKTSLAFPQEKISLLTDFVLKGWQWMTRGVNTVPGTMDRSASRRDALHSSDIRQLLPYLIDLIPQRQKELNAIVDHQNNKGSLVGFSYFPYSDFASYQQPAFSFFVKTVSTRTLSTESINSENLKGHFLNSGDAYLIHDGNEYFNLMPAWNWEYLPGITSFIGAEKIMRQPFVGSVSNGKHGFTSMNYVLENKDGSRFISAKKSWFCYRDKVVCLVADLKGEGVDSAYTVMDQCRWNGDVTTNKKANTVSEVRYFFDRLKWVHHGSFLYMSLNNTQTEIQLNSVTGNWATINASESDELVKERIFMPVLLHGNLGRGNSFGYLMAYCKTPADAKCMVKDPRFRVIRNDSTCQAVIFPGDVVMASFFQPGFVVVNKKKILVDKPCLVLINEGKMYVSDPQQVNSSISIKLNERTFHVQLPDHGFSTAGISVK